MVRVTKNHIRLLKKSYWRLEDCEYGAPAMDCKRPYGNSDVEGDIAEILNMDLVVCPNCGEEINGVDWRATAKAYHSDMLEVIQHLMATLNEDNYPEV